MKITRNSVNNILLNYFQSYFGKDRAGYLSVLIPAALFLAAILALALPASLMMKRFRKSKRTVLMVLIVFNLGVILMNIIHIETYSLLKKALEKVAYNDVIRLLIALNLAAVFDPLIPSIDGAVIPFYLTQALHVLSSLGLFFTLFDLKLYGLLLFLMTIRTILNTFVLVSSMSSFCKAGPIYVNSYNMVIFLYVLMTFFEGGIAGWLVKRGFENNAHLVMSLAVVGVSNFIMAIKYQVWKPKIVVTTHERVVRKSPHKK